MKYLILLALLLAEAFPCAAMELLTSSEEHYPLTKFHEICESANVEDFLKALLYTEEIRKEALAHEWTSLHIAVIRGHLQLTKNILQKCPPIIINSTDNEGNSPLFFAAEAGNDDLVKLLLAAGADPNAPNAQGRTPLHEAIANNHHSTTKLLIAQDANIDVHDNELNTPWHEALNVKAEQIVTLLEQVSLYHDAQKQKSSIAQQPNPSGELSSGFTKKTCGSLPTKPSSEEEPFKNELFANKLSTDNQAPTVPLSPIKEKTPSITPVISVPQPISARPIRRSTTPYTQIIETAPGQPPITVRVIPSGIRHPMVSRPQEITVAPSYHFNSNQTSIK